MSNEFDALEEPSSAVIKRGGEFLSTSKADTLSTLTEAYATMAHAYTAMMTDGKMDKYDLSKAKDALENIAKEISRVAVAAEGNE